MKSLLIVGAGEYGQLVHEIASALNYDKIAYLDDNSALALAAVADYANYRDEYEEFIVAIGNPDLRSRMTKELSQCYKPATLIHPLAYVSPSASIGCGSVVEPMAVVQANTVIGEGCIINSGAVVNHNCKLGSFVQVDCNATIKARAVVLDHSKVNAGSIFE